MSAPVRKDRRSTTERGRMTTHAGRVALGAARLGVGAVTAIAPCPDIARRATEIDFAIASRIDTVRALLLKPTRVTVLSGRLQAQIDALGGLRQELPPAAAKDLDAQKGQLEWLVSELRHGM